VASSTNLSNVTSSGGFLTGFDASGTGSLKRVLPHPIPVGHYRDFALLLSGFPRWRFRIRSSYYPALAVYRGLSGVRGLLLRGCERRGAQDIVRGPGERACAARGKRAASRSFCAAVSRGLGAGLSREGVLCMPRGAAGYAERGGSRRRNRGPAGEGCWSVCGRGKERERSRHPLHGSEAPGDGKRVEPCVPDPGQSWRQFGS
jgi:hypothetical protein